ncbi:MAG TPA: cupin domain-containing protein [Gaiellaceae bacterium]|nr:cupin domain-containing protein [Gaiellaceae bacterium]
MSEWFVKNARDSQWVECKLGIFCDWDSTRETFPELGINLNLMQPGEAMTMYHRENKQEDFLVLEGECLLIVEGEERPLKKWDLFHCPPGVAHAIVGAGDGPSLVLAVGARPAAGVVYPADPVAQKHGAGVAEETSIPKEAYAGIEFPQVPYKEGWLSD